VQSRGLTRGTEASEERVKTSRARLQFGLLALLAAVFLLVDVWVYGLARDTIRGDVDQFVSDKALLLAYGANTNDISLVDFRDRDWRADPFTPYGQTFDLSWNPRFVSSRLSQPILPTDEIKRRAKHPLRLLLHDAVGPDGLSYRMATATIARNDQVFGYAQIGVRLTERDAPLRRLRAMLAAGSLVGLGLAAAGIHYTLREWRLPLLTLAETARSVTAHGVARHRFVAPPDSPELAEMARAFNQLLDHLAVMQESQQRFIADASHEMRTPLTILRGELEVALRHERTAGEYRETIQSCREEIDRLSRLANDLLALARLDSGARLELREVLDLGTLCRETVERLAPRARELGVRLEAEATLELPIAGDQLALERVFENLVDNALRHSPRGEWVAIRTIQNEKDAVVEISDRGPGIAEEHRRRIFDRFYRVELSRSRDRGGAGLGLAIVKALIEAHGGSVEVRSEIGQGSTFVVRLPLSHGAA
jgi:heavy metal sensor kinase